MAIDTKVVAMESDVIGRVKNTNLAKTSVLLPLFEAIVMEMILLKKRVH